MFKKISIFCFGLLMGCVRTTWNTLDDFKYVQIKTEKYTIATWQKIRNPKNNNIHIYIEGDGNAYNAYGRPTSDPTPQGTFVRDLVRNDNFENVVYMARPCQYIMDDNCKQTDWTQGRFSQQIINAQTEAIKQIANDKKITLIGYSGGGMLSGLIINQNPQMNFEKWITIAGVLNHDQWTQYFGDAPLTESLDMVSLPKIPQTHFVGERDRVVPYELSKQWVDEKNIVLIPNATHDDFFELKLFD